MMPNSCEEQQQQGRQSSLSIDPSTILDSSSNYFVKFKSNNKNDNDGDGDNNIDDIPINNYGQESLDNDNINFQKFCNHKLISQNESDPFETIRSMNIHKKIMIPSTNQTVINYQNNNQDLSSSSSLSLLESKIQNIYNNNNNKNDRQKFQRQMATTKTLTKLLTSINNNNHNDDNNNNDDDIISMTKKTTKIRTTSRSSTFKIDENNNNYYYYHFQHHFDCCCCCCCCHDSFLLPKRCSSLPPSSPPSSTTTTTTLSSKRSPSLLLLSTLLPVSATTTTTTTTTAILPSSLSSSSSSTVYSLHPNSFKKLSLPSSSSSSLSSNKSFKIQKFCWIIFFLFTLLSSDLITIMMNMMKTSTTLETMSTTNNINIFPLLIVSATKLSPYQLSQQQQQQRISPYHQHDRLYPFERAQYTEHLQLDRSHSNNNENKQAKIDSKTLEQLRLDSVKNRLLTKLNLEIPPKTTDITEADREEIRELIRRTGLEMIGTTDQHQHRKRRHRKSLISSADEFHSNDDFDEYDDDEDDSHEEYKKEASEMVIFAEPGNNLDGHILLTLKAPDNLNKINVTKSIFWLRLIMNRRLLNRMDPQSRTKILEKSAKVNLYRLADNTLMTNTRIPRIHSRSFFQKHSSFLNDNNNQNHHNNNDEEIKLKKLSFQLLATHQLKSLKHGWIKFDLTKSINNWFKSVKQQQNAGDLGKKLTLLVDCPDCNNIIGVDLGNGLQQHSSGKNGRKHRHFRPYLLLKTEMLVKSRQRRHSYNCEDVKKGTCCKQKLYVDFKDIGWSWIIYPEGFIANYCMGDCQYSHTNDLYAFPHSHVLDNYRVVHKNETISTCCSPSKLSPLSVVYYDNNKNPIKRDIENMIVDECGCTF